MGREARMEARTHLCCFHLRVQPRLEVGLQLLRRGIKLVVKGAQLLASTCDTGLREEASQQGRAPAAPDLKARPAPTPALASSSSRMPSFSSFVWRDAYAALSPDDVLRASVAAMSC